MSRLARQDEDAAAAPGCAVARPGKQKPPLLALGAVGDVEAARQVARRLLGGAGAADGGGDDLLETMLLTSAGLQAAQAADDVTIEEVLDVLRGLRARRGVEVFRRSRIALVRYVGEELHRLPREHLNPCLDRLIEMHPRRGGHVCRGGHGSPQELDLA